MKDDSREHLVVAFSAGTVAEAMVIRSLLQSEGINSPDPAPAYPFPLSEPIEGSLATDILVLESKSDEARRVIDEYLKGNAGADAASDQ
jgi:hypothetical protein